jgi:hypothetical protein
VAAVVVQDRLAGEPEVGGGDGLRPEEGLQQAEVEELLAAGGDDRRIGGANDDQEAVGDGEDDGHLRGAARAEVDAAAPGEDGAGGDHADGQQEREVEGDAADVIPQVEDDGEDDRERDARAPVGQAREECGGDGRPQPEEGQRECQPGEDGPECHRRGVRRGPVYLF